MVQEVGPFDRPLVFLESFAPGLFPTGFSMVLSGKPPSNSPPIPGNLVGGGAPLLELPPFLSPPPGVTGADLPGDRLLFAFMSLFEFELGLLPPPTIGADRSLVTVFFSALPCCMDLSKAPRSLGLLLLGFPPPPPTFMGGGLGGPGGPGGGPGGGGGGGIISCNYHYWNVKILRN